ncbi:hypothetical protein QFC19_000642 [Naganishia cerealis]|uniref:Uncharacterized protein n=1 Tax=Naganishia cerealis TaxID=610337 RepID=A0ACC2WQ14_9TREE|nr:hypothetical protein QFC19_000642 [Naganishia cerealis]
MLARTSFRAALPWSSRLPIRAVAQRAYSTVKPDEVVAGDVGKKVAELEELVKELKSQLTYGKADFINLQRRTEQEKTSTRDFAIQGFASDLLATVDILTTALKYVPQPISASDTHLTSLFSGVQMTQQQLIKTLAKHGVTQFDPTGEKFDPMRHEALFQAPIPGKEPGTVLECQKTGFMIKSRTLRPAQVGVVQDLS